MKKIFKKIFGHPGVPRTPLKMTKKHYFQGVSWHAHLDFGIIEGAAGQRRITTCQPRFSDLAPSLHCTVYACAYLRQVFNSLQLGLFELIEKSTICCKYCKKHLCDFFLIEILIFRSPSIPLHV
jgi:hypothetical protein